MALRYITAEFYWAERWRQFLAGHQRDSCLLSMGSEITGVLSQTDTPVEFFVVSFTAERQTNSGGPTSHGRGRICYNRRAVATRHLYTCKG